MRRLPFAALLISALGAMIACAGAVGTRLPPPGESGQGVADPIQQQGPVGETGERVGEGLQGCNRKLEEAFDAVIAKGRQRFGISLS